jgi:hypothetical protein
MNMKCEQCGRLVDDKPCPFCQSTRVRELRPGEAVTAEARPASPAPIITPPPRAHKVFEPPAPATPEPPRKQPPPPRIVETVKTPPSPRKEQPSPPREEQWTVAEATANTVREPIPRPPAPEVKQKEIRGLAEFEALLNVEHFKSVIVCGRSQSGKSEITSGFTRANTIFRGRAQSSTLRSTSDKMYSLGGTVPDEVWFQPINTRKKLVFLDPSGEFFRQISPTERQRLKIPEVTPEHFRFVRAAVEKLAGIILVVDLTKTLDELGASPWLNQEIDLDFTLGALRFLRHDSVPENENINLSTLIAARLPGLPRLDVPVLVLFSKADMLSELKIETFETPFGFARRRLPRLHASLRTHASRYHFDFVHTMRATDPSELGPDESEVKAVQVPRPCGVLLSMEWLLTDPFRWIPSLPTRFLEGF